AQKGFIEGKLLKVIEESSFEGEEDSSSVQLSEQQGFIQSDLSAGAYVTKATQLQSNSGLSNQGVTPLGTGFRLTRSELEAMGYSINNLPSVIRPYVIGKD